ncbi:MAG: anti-sigma factor family protein [Saccharofermentanales bacterium]|jgi:hypothetical protein
MKMFCNKWRLELLREQDNELDTASLIKLQAHLEVCSDCRAERELLIKARSAVAPLRAQRLAVVVPEGLSQLVMAGINAEPELEAEETEITAVADSAANTGSYWSKPGRQRSLRYASALLLVFMVVTLVFVYRNVALSQRATQSSFAMATTAAMAGIPTNANDSGAYTTGGRQETSQVFNQEGSTAATATRPPEETRTAGGMTIYGTTAGTTAATTVAAPGYRLYTGSLTELDKLVKSGEKLGLQPQLLSNASVLRILTSPADAAQPVKKAVILAGYPIAEATSAADSFRGSVPPDALKITVELIPPGDQPLLVKLFGEALYSQLLPTEKERQLTYVLITVGG